jgi:serine/threonine-protein kinase
VDQTLQAALQLAPDLPEAHAVLVERAWARHREAEAARQPRRLAEAETLLTTHARALADAHPLRGQVAAYLQGEGALTLVTDPPGARVVLHRYATHNRRLIETDPRPIGTTPLRAVPLPMGSYVCHIRHPDREDVRYPIHIPRRGHWDSVGPGDDEPHPVWLPPRGHLDAHEVYVPGGWFVAGGDPAAPSLPEARAWCHGFVMDRFPITNVQYLSFLHDLVANGREAEALDHVPRERAGSAHERGALIYAYSGGRFSLRADAEGDVWRPHWPVLHVDWFGARAYLAWRAERSGRPWRLPHELEWEKAARGVDARFFPWGDYADPSWCRVFDSARGPEHHDHGPVVVDSYPVDSSPYGVRGMAGNVRDWCLDRVDAPDPRIVDDRVATRPVDPDANVLRVGRGGQWSAHVRLARAPGRSRSQSTVRHSDLGFRGLWRVTP